MSVRGNSLMENGRVRHSLLRGTRPCACLPPQRFPQRLTGRCRAAPRRGASCVARCCPEGRTQAPGPCPPEASLERGGHLSRILTTPEPRAMPHRNAPCSNPTEVWVGGKRESERSSAAESPPRAPPTGARRSESAGSLGLQGGQSATALRVAPRPQRENVLRSRLT